VSCPSNPLDCVGDAISGVTGAAAGGVLGAFADAIRSGVADLVKATLTWWVRQDSVDIAATPVDRLQHLLLPVTLLVAVGSLMWQGVRMTLSRKPDPLWDAGRGLAVLAFVTGAGVTALAGALRAGDALSGWVLDQASGGQFSQRLIEVLSMQGVAGPGTVILLGMVTFFVTLLQWVLLFFRQGSLVVLAGLLPLAAAGSMSPGTRPWLRRLLAWLLSIVAYKPMVAFIYAAGFTLFGEGKDLSTVVLGVVVLALSVVALPALLRFFSWGVDAGAAHLGGAASGALASGLGAATAGITVAGMRSGGSAAEHASSIDRALPARGGAGSGAATGAEAGSAPAAAGAASALAGAGLAVAAARGATTAVAGAVPGPPPGAGPSAAASSATGSAA